MSSTFFSAFDATQPLVNLRPGRHVVKGKINRTTTRRIRRNVDFLFCPRLHVNFPIDTCASADSINRTAAWRIRPGLAAAAAIFALAGIINQQITEREEIAYEAVIEPDLTTASDDPIAGQYLAGVSDGTALRYYLSN